MQIQRFENRLILLRKIRIHRHQITKILIVNRTTGSRNKIFKNVFFCSLYSTLIQIGFREATYIVSFAFTETGFVFQKVFKCGIQIIYVEEHFGIFLTEHSNYISKVIIHEIFLYHFRYCKYYPRRTILSHSYG